MKVHIFVRDYPPTGGRSGVGVNKAVAGLAAGLVAQGAAVTILCLGSEESHVETPDGYDVRCFVREGRLGFRVPHALAAYVAAARGDGIFLLNAVFSPAVYALSRVCLRQGVPYVFWPHDPYHPALFVTRALRKKAYWHLCERRLLRDAQAVQTLSSYQRTWLRDLGIRTPCIETANGYAPEDVLPDAALQWRSEGPARLLFLGRLDRVNKGLDILIDAFARIRDRTDACLTLQGPDWGDRAALQAQAERLGLGEPRLSFREPDFSKSAAELMAEHDALVLPSRFEGFALASLEAMCAGRVLLVSDINGIADHVARADCGVVVRPEVGAVADGLLRLLDRRADWQRMGRQGRDYALRNFHWDNIAAALLARYAQLLHPAGDAAPASPPQAAPKLDSLVH